SNFLSLTLVPLLIFLSFFLNFLSSLYSEVDLFKVDLTKNKANKQEFKKVSFVLKNNQLFFAIICFIQVIFNLFVSLLIFENMEEEFIQRLWIGKGVLVLLT